MKKTMDYKEKRVFAQSKEDETPQVVTGTLTKIGGRKKRRLTLKLRKVGKKRLRGATRGKRLL